MTPRISTSEITMSDYYCGAGGSSSGAVATGAVTVKMAVNHWDLAIATHNTNHPDTDHDKADLNTADPARYPRTTIGWFSPECTNWSAAKGKKLPSGQLAWDFFGDSMPDEAAERSRMGMWDVPRFAAHHLYDIVIVENVPRVVKGAQWLQWLRAMHELGYLHEVVWLNSMHAQTGGAAAPQSRDRVYITFWRAANRKPDFDKWLRPVALCDVHGLVKSVQVFKPGGSPMKTYRAQYTLRCPHRECRGAEVFPAVPGADTIIDWSLRGVRIRDRETRGMDPLADKTMRRIMAGARRHWRPQIVEAAGNTYDATSPRHPQHGDLDAYHRSWAVDEPLRTLHTTSSKALVVRGEGNLAPARAVDSPIGAITASGSQFLVDPLPLTVPVEGREGVNARPVDGPLRTQSTRNETGLLVPVGGTWRDAATTLEAPMPARTTRETDALVVPLRNHGVAKPVGDPIDTVAASGNHHALVMRNNTARGDAGQMSTLVGEPLRTLTTAGHQSLIVPPPLSDLELWELAMDSEFRMLEPVEIKRGMSFSIDYVLLGNKREQVRMAGNAVTPNAARDLILACVESLGYDVDDRYILAA